VCGVYAKFEFICAIACEQAWSAFISQGNVQSVLALYDRAAVMYDLWSGVPSMSSGDQIPRYVAGLYANGTGVLDPATNPQIVVDAITSVTPGVGERRVLLLCGFDLNLSLQWRCGGTPC
jgi:hypothetical protein